jgi:hypothetical protein
MVVICVHFGQSVLFKPCSMPDDSSSGIGEDEAAPNLLYRLLDLPAELLVLIAAQLAEDDELAASLACRKLREAVASTERRAACAPLSTWIGSALCSVGKLEWAVAACRMPLKAKLFTYAARDGQLEQLRWLGANGCVFTPEDQHKDVYNDPDTWKCMHPLEGAAQGGHLEVLLWFIAHGAPWDEGICSQAARFGHLVILKWARANGCPLYDDHMCAYAADGGHLDILRWLRANGCPWAADTCERAAMGGHLAVLQWLRANRCPWGEERFIRHGPHAPGGGHLAVLRWARANGRPWEVG